jgi:hypothetical protein
MSTCLYESEAGDCQTALVVSDVCVERYGAGRVKEQCERDKKPALRPGEWVKTA